MEAQRSTPLTSAAIESKLRDRLTSSPAVTLRLDIINKCNLRCVMCHYSDETIARRKARSFTPEEFAAFFDDIAPMVQDIMLSCGDEPLMSKHFTSILQVIASHPEPRDVGLCTNATLMNGKVRDAIIQYGVTYILLSMDGVTKGSLERIRVGANYERVVANIMALRDLKKATGTRYPRMVLDFVMMESNIHEAPTFVEMAKQLGIAMVDFRHAVPSFYWNDENEKLSNHAAKFNYYRERILEQGKKHNVEIYIPDTFATEGIWLPASDIPQVDLHDFQRVEPDHASSHLPVPRSFPDTFVSGQGLDPSREFFGASYCHRPFSEIMLRNQSEVLPCPWHQKVLGYLDENTSLKEIFFGEPFRVLRENMFKPQGDPNCQGCPVKADYLPTRSSGKGNVRRFLNTSRSLILRCFRKRRLGSFI